MAGIDFGALLFAYILIMILVRLGLCIWIYSDGTGRGIRVGAWIAVAILHPLVGFILYHSERNRLRPEPEYQYWYPPPAYYPGPYHSGPPPSYVTGGYRAGPVCLNCRSRIPPGSAFCPFCGDRQ
jgi:hypothetical protein